MASFTLGWSASTDNVGVTGYEVMQDSTNLGTKTTTSTAVTGLAPNTPYAMKVRARDAAGNWSAWSSATSVTTLADSAAPSVPGGLSSASVTSGSFALNWSASSDNVGVTGYEVMQGSASLGTKTTTSVAVTGLAPNSTYSMKVRARDAAGNWSAWSTELPVTTSAAADAVVPSVPAVLAASSVGVASFTLSWPASTDNVGVVGYEVMRDGTGLGTTAGTTFSIVGLVPLTTYAMKVRARDAAGNWSAWSAALGVTTSADTVAPSAPAALGSNSTETTSLQLHWQASSDNSGGAITYEIYDASRDVLLGTSTATAWMHTGLTANAVVFYRVRARDLANNCSAFTASVMGVTASCVLDADSDGDGMADAWEDSNGLNLNDASDAALDPDGDYCSNLEEFRMGWNPRVPVVVHPSKTSTEADRTAMLVAKAKGPGTVTLRVTDEYQTRDVVFLFTGATGTWNTPFTANGSADVDFRISIAAETDYSVQVVSSTVQDFFVGLRDDPSGRRLRRAAYTFNGMYLDQISRAEAGSVFTIRADLAESLAFAECDLTPIKRFRHIVLGLGTDVRGRSAGFVHLRLNVGVVTGQPGNIEPGPGLLWWFRRPAREQALVPSGLVDIQYEASRTAVRFYAGAQFTKTGDFYELPSGTPTAYYQQDRFRSGEYWGEEVTRAAGTDVEVLRFEAASSSALLEQYEIPNYGPPGGQGTLYIEIYSTLGVTRFWPWHRRTAPRPGLVEYRKSSMYSRRKYLTPEWVDDPHIDIQLATTTYATPEVSASVLSREVAFHPEGDMELVLSPYRVERGIGDDQYCDWTGISVQFINQSTGTVTRTSRLNTGGATLTELFRNRSARFPANLGTQPMGAVGQPKETRVSFGDGDANDANALVTTYTYADALGGSKTLVSSAVTKQGSTEVGRRTYTYSLGTFNGKETEITTAVEYASAAASLVTETAAYSSRLADPDIRDRRVYVISPDGTKISCAYQRGTLTGATWTASPSGPHLLVAELAGRSGSAVTAFRGVGVASLDMDAGKSTVTEHIRDAAGRVLREATFVYQADGSFAELASIYSRYDALGHLVTKADQPIAVGGSTSGRLLYEASFNGFRKHSERDETGTLLTFDYDAYGRVATVARASAGSTATGDYVPPRTTTFAYDPAGRLLTETVGSTDTTQVLQTTYAYDTAGRLTSKALPGGFTTRTTHPILATVTDPVTTATVTNPAGGTVVTDFFKDGRVKAVSGTETVDSTTTYAYSSVGNLVATTTLTGASPQSVTSIEIDWLGRPLTQERTAWQAAKLFEATEYKTSTGQLWRRSTRSGSPSGTKLLPSRLFEYDAYGRLQRTATDTNDNGAIDLGSDADIEEHEFKYEQQAFSRLDTGAAIGSAWYRYEGVKVYPYEGANAATGRFGSQLYTQVGGLTAAWAAHTIGYDFDRNPTQSFAAIDRAARQQTVTTFTAGSSQVLIERSLNGQVMESTNAQGHTTDLAYDGLGRLVGFADPRLGLTSTTYAAGVGTNQTSILVASTTTPDGKTTSFGYDSAGRQTRVIAPDGKTSYCQYDAAGNLTHVWGDTVNPVKYVYDEKNRRTEMHSYRSGTWAGAALPTGFAAAGDKTTWVYDASSGLLASKIDASGKATSYTYDGAGRMLTRIDARGVVTTYGYFGSTEAGSGQFHGLQKSVAYSVVAGVAATPNLSYAYHRTGKIKTVVDAAGTRTFSYFESCDTPQGFGARLASEVLPAGFYGSRTLAYSYQYSVAGRRNGELASVQYGTAADYRTAYAYDDRLRLAQVGTGGATLPFDYTYTDSSSLVGSVVQWSGTATAYNRLFEYEADSNRLASLSHAWGATNAIDADYGYNAAGLRANETTAGSAFMAALGRTAGLYADFTYTARRELDTAGQYELVGAAAKGAVIAASARDFDYDAFGNRTADQSGAYTLNALNQYSTAPGAATLGYDLTGNLTGDGTRTYTYDAENRLATVVQGGVTTTFKYDYLGRRISKQVGSGAETRFVYDGWNLIAELTAGTYAIQRTYYWGLDASGSLQGAGGVGGLLCIATGTQRYYPVYDGSCNVTGYYDGSGAIAAAYRYDPFGNQLQGVGVAASLPIGFSTKYTDRETGLVYYGLRYYHAPLGRFINRDPLEEQGGLNLYAFCGNDGVNRWDYLGLNDFDDEAYQEALRVENRTRSEWLNRWSNGSKQIVEPERVIPPEKELPPDFDPSRDVINLGLFDPDAIRLQAFQDEAYQRFHMEEDMRNDPNSGADILAGTGDSPTPDGSPRLNPKGYGQYEYSRTFPFRTDVHGVRYGVWVQQVTITGNIHGYGDSETTSARSRNLGAGPRVSDQNPLISN